jgi:hypothetical protein
MIIMKNWIGLFLLGSMVFVLGCYRFVGIAIDQNVQTYYVAQFDNRANNVVATLAPDFTEKLKDKIRNESRLLYSDVDPHIEFSGSITRYDVSAEAPQPDEQIAFNKLTISVSVELVNNVIEEESKKFTKNWYAEFPSDQNLLDIQDDLIESITDQLVEDIFTEAFTNW